MEKWKRRQNEMRHLWDLTEFEDAQVQRADYGGEFKIDPVRKEVILQDRINEDTRRLIVEIPLSIFGIAMILGIFYGFIELADWAEPDESLGETTDNISRGRYFL